MIPLVLLRAVCEALVARGDAAVIEGAYLYVGETPVALATVDKVVVRGVLGADDRDVLSHARRTPTGKPGQVAEIIALIDKRQAARAAQEVPCAA